MRRRFSLAAIAILTVTTPAWAQNSVSNIRYPTVVTPFSVLTGNAWQQVLPAVSSTRRSITIQNNNLTDNCWIFIGPSSPTPNKVTSILLTPGGSYSRFYPYIPFDAIQATCVNNGDTLYVDSQ